MENKLKKIMKKVALVGLMIISLNSFSQINKDFLKLYENRILKEYPCDIMRNYYYNGIGNYYLNKEELIKYFFKCEDSLYYKYNSFNMETEERSIATATKSVSLLFMIEYKNFKIISYQKYEKSKDFDIMAYIYDNKNRLKDSLSIGVNCDPPQDSERETIFLSDDTFLRFSYGIDKNGKLEDPSPYSPSTQIMELYKVDKKNMKFKKIKEMNYEEIDSSYDEFDKNLPMYMKRLGLDYNKYYKKQKK